jgi:phosphotransferase system  glucose/maltose/N-acetylglucosamine-specific IIC component
MEEEPRFEQVRAEIEAKQKSILWEDGLRNGRSVDEFFWKGDPKAKPVQKAGLVVFAVFFWLLGVFLIASVWAREEWGGRFFGSLMGLAIVLVSIRLFFNAILKPKRHPDDGNSREQ